MDAFELWCWRIYSRHCVRSVWRMRRFSGGCGKGEHWWKQLGTGEVATFVGTFKLVHHLVWRIGERTYHDVEANTRIHGRDQIKQKIRGGKETSFGTIDSNLWAHQTSGWGKKKRFICASSSTSIWKSLLVKTFRVSHLCCSADGAGIKYLLYKIVRYNV